MNNYSFPTLGEVVKYLFSITGVLSQEPEAKKTIQTQLRRLAKEETELKDNLERLFGLFEEYISTVLKDERITKAFSFFFKYLFSHYEEVARTQGACLPRTELFKWLIQNHLLSRVVFAYQKYFYMFNIPGSGLNWPNDRFWWLPDIDGQEVKWPLAKVFQWIYTVADTNQTHFHYPEYNDLTKDKDYRLGQNLENASNWANLKQEPRWDNLLSNLEESLKALEECPLKQYQQTFDDSIKSSFRIMLFLSRISSLAFSAIDKQLGRAFLKDVIADFKRQDRRLRKKTKEHLHSTSLLVGFSSQSSPAEIDRIWFQESCDYWQQDANWATIAIPKAVQLVNTVDANWDIRVLKFLVESLGAFDARDIVQQHKAKVHSWYHPRFFELLYKGRTLKRGGTTNDQIDDFCAELKNENLDDSLGWMKNWIRGAYYYRQEKFDLAYPYYKSAFNQAKYSAGEDQYKLVNQYIEVSAKNGKRQSFKRGVAWANYLGIEIRWLRNTKGTEEDFEFTYEMLKKANHPVL